jgi:glucose-1-phosphate thymidylyltransferase
MLAGIREVLVISTPRDTPMIEGLLGDGSQLGMKLSYAVQPNPGGIAQAFLIGESFARGSPVCLILGDNIFYGHNLTPALEKAAQLQSGARLFAYHVQDPERYGVVEFDRSGKVLGLEEKPKTPRSSWAVTGLYFYDGEVVDRAKALKPSARGELEITDLNRDYLTRGEVTVELFGRGVAWLDSGTYESLQAASQFVQTLEARQGLKVACIEEIAFAKGWITAADLEKLSEHYANSPYGLYLKQVLREGPLGPRPAPR